MKLTHFFILFPALVSAAFAAEPVNFSTQWIPSKPEILTYRSTSKQGDGLYQVSIARNDSTIEIYMNIITNGFTKTVAGTMGFDLTPIGSVSRIFVHNQISMDTRTSFERTKLHISTKMMPFNREMKNDPEFSGRVFDFSQNPLIPRVLDLSVKKDYSFQALNPQTNQIGPLTVKVLGEETVKNIACYKVEMNDFEGRAFLWIEKGNMRRTIRIEQPESGRISELIL